MKKIRYIALLLSIAAGALSASAATKQFTLAFDENDFRFSTNEYGELVIQPADPMSTMPAGGLPALPQFSTVIAVGERQTYKSHEISVSKRLVRSGIVMEPAQFAVPTDSIFAGAKFERVFPDYDLAQYPADNCEYATTSHWAGGVSTLHFLSCPFVYNPEGGELYFIDSMTLTVELDETPVPARVATSSAVRHETPWFVHDMVINPDDIPSGPQRAAAAADQTGYVDPNRIDYVIITTHEFKQAFEPLAAWKKAKGVPSKIITIEEINTKYEGKDTQLRIKKCLKDLYDNNGLKFVLLGGDDTVVPVRGCYSKCSGHVDKNIPCDLYYACFGGTFDWNLDKDNLYGESGDGIDFAPSIAITRLPIRGNDHVNDFLLKLKAYETSPRFNSDNGNVLMAGFTLGFIKGLDENGNLPNDAEQAGDEVYVNSIQPYWNGARTRFYDTVSDIEGVKITPQTLQEEIAKGYNFLQMLSHGGNSFWRLSATDTGDAPAYDSDCAKTQANTGFTIVTTMACNTNAFDDSQFPCLSELLIRNKDSGIITYLGSSRYNWGQNDRPSTWSSIIYEKAFYRNLFNVSFEQKHFGDIVAASKASNISSAAYGTSHRWLQFSLNPIGDPEMPIYTKKMLSFDNAYVAIVDDAQRPITPVIPGSEYSVTDTLLIKTGVPNCNVCVMSLDDDGDSYYKIFNNIEQLKLTDYPKNISICISKPTEYYPRQFIVRHVQNQSLSRSTPIRADIVRIGSSVYPRSAEGDVNIEKLKTRIYAKKIIIKSGVKVATEAGIVLDNNR